MNRRNSLFWPVGALLTSIRAGLPVARVKNSINELNISDRNPLEFVSKPQDTDTDCL